MVHNRIKAFIQKEDGEKMTARLIDDAHWQILVTAARQLKQSARYQNASQKAPFDAAYAQLQDLEQNRDVTLKQFLKVQESLAHAVTRLDGQETTTFVLRQAVSDAELLMETARYVNASPLAKEERWRPREKSFRPMNSCCSRRWIKPLKSCSIQQRHSVGLKATLVN